MKILFTISLFLTLLTINSYIYCSFQLSLFSTINKENKSKNLSISPLGIFHILSLTSNGSFGNTQNEMLKTLEYPGIELLNEINYQIFTTLNKISTIKIANAIMSKFSPLDSFKNVAKDNYNVEISPLKSLYQINQWCNRKTKGKIKKILDILDDNIFMVLLNAIYFNDKWEHSFDKSSTSKKIFYSLGNKQTNVDIMSQTNDFGYYENSEIQAIELPYEHDSMSALIILPKTNVDINNFIEKLDENYIYKINNKFNLAKVKIELPKFKINFQESLVKTLKEMGMNEAFTLKADFSGIRKQNDLLIDDVIHKTYLSVDEKGTEAAAVTIVEFMAKSAGPMKLKYYEMNVNRPFLFIIKNHRLPKNNDIIFISKIVELS